MKKTKIHFRFFQDETHYERLFFLFLTLVMAVIYIIALNSSSALHRPWTLVLFTLQMNVHVVFYWVSPWVYAHRRWLGPYIILQLGLAFSLGMMSRVVALSFGLYLGLLGLLIGAPLRRLVKGLVLVGVLLVSALNYILISGAGTLAWWFLSMIPVTIFTSLYVYLYIRQAEARERAQQLLVKLEVANKQLSEYAAQVEDLTLATERQRMARELHDTLSQGLAGLILQLEAVDAHLEGQRTERARLILHQSMQKARDTLTEARQAIDHLRAPLEYNLAESARQECEDFTFSTGIPCENQIAIPSDLPERIEEAAGKVISECLANSARHSRAKHASVRLEEADGALTIEISDDGAGFDPQAVDTGHYGLLGMRERVRLAGGQVEVHSRPGEGTRIRAVFPLSVGPGQASSDKEDEVIHG